MKFRFHDRIQEGDFERAPGSIPATRLMIPSARIRYSPMTFRPNPELKVQLSRQQRFTTNRAKQGSSAGRGLRYGESRLDRCGSRRVSAKWKNHFSGQPTFTMTQAMVTSHMGIYGDPGVTPETGGLHEALLFT